MVDLYPAASNAATTFVISSGSKKKGRTPAAMLTRCHVFSLALTAVLELAASIFDLNVSTEDAMAEDELAREIAVAAEPTEYESTSGKSSLFFLKGGASGATVAAAHLSLRSLQEDILNTTAKNGGACVLRRRTRNCPDKLEACSSSKAVLGFSEPLDNETRLSLRAPWRSLPVRS